MGAEIAVASSLLGSGISVYEADKRKKREKENNAVKLAQIEREKKAKLARKRALQYAKGYSGNTYENSLINFGANYDEKKKNSGSDSASTARSKLNLLKDVNSIFGNGG